MSLHICILLLCRHHLLSEAPHPEDVHLQHARVMSSEGRGAGSTTSLPLPNTVRWLSIVSPGGRERHIPPGADLVLKFTEVSPRGARAEKGPSLVGPSGLFLPTVHHRSRGRSNGPST